MSALTQSRSWTAPLFRLMRNPVAAVGVVLLALVAIIGISAPWVFPWDPLLITGDPLIWPFTDAAHPLGTDSLGRDIAAGLAHGSRMSLMIGLTAALISATLGVIAGAAAGYYGGWIDQALVRVIELFQTLPNFVLTVVVIAIASPTFFTIALVLGLISWPEVARLTRAEFRSIKARDFVSAAVVSGMRDSRIIATQILPNALPPIIVSTSMVVAHAIMMESALSFMGLGDPNVVSWGSMIGSGREMLRSAWYICALPGVAIMITVASLNFVSDALNDALNPRHAGNRR